MYNKLGYYIIASKEVMAMMGVQDPPQGKLYYTNFNLDERIRPSHPVRRIDPLIDFIYQEVADQYG